MLPKAPLTSHSKMSSSRWVTTPSWLSSSLRPFFYSSVYSCHLFLITSASVRSIPFLSFIVPILAWNVPLISPIFLKRTLVFSILLFSSILCIVHLRRPSYLSLVFSGTLHSVECIFPILPCLLLLFFSQLFVKPPQTTTLPSCISFSLVWFWSLPPVQCYKPPSVRKSTMDIHRKDWYWSWSSNTLAIWCKDLTHSKRSWSWERLKANGEGGSRGWDG